MYQILVATIKTPQRINQIQFLPIFTLLTTNTLFCYRFTLDTKRKRKLHQVIPTNLTDIFLPTGKIFPANDTMLGENQIQNVIFKTNQRTEFFGIRHNFQTSLLFFLNQKNIKREKTKTKKRVI